MHQLQLAALLHTASKQAWLFFGSMYQVQIAGLLHTDLSRHDFISMHQLQIAGCSDQFLAGIVQKHASAACCRLLRQIPSRDDI